MRLEVKGIGKAFGPVSVLRDADITVGEGEIAALLGENGAGKSTLMNIVGGVYAPDAGEIRINGKKVSFASPKDSQNAGIAFIHQELNLIENLTVCENMFLSSFPRKGAFLDEKNMLRKTAELFARLGIDIDPRLPVSSLDQSYKQMVEIAKALMTDASLIIMDEPTSSLPPTEISRVFDFMRALKEKKISMIFISHKLVEVMEICDTYTVLRNGTVAGRGNVADTNPEALASLMVGHSVERRAHRQNAGKSEEVLRLSSFSDGDAFDGISLTLHRGEILGITGLLGDGRSELFETVFGVRNARTEGQIFLEGKSIRPASSTEAMQLGIGYLAKDRKINGILPDLSILSNGTVSTLRQYRKFGWFDTAKQKTAFRRSAQPLHIRYHDEEGPITSLSGGNQQKTLLMRRLLCEPKVLILDNPTQGVDIGAKEEIYSIIETLAEKGISLILLSSEAQEILRICDRAIVLFHGRIAGEVKGEDMNEHTLMLLASGAKKEESD